VEEEKKGENAQGEEWLKEPEVYGDFNLCKTDTVVPSTDAIIESA
jgi:hypothetical protein